MLRPPGVQEHLHSSLKPTSMVICSVRTMALQTQPR
jgi:hypothetical protein